jgi:hypothetical protein
MKKMWRKGNPNEKMWRKGNPNEKMWRTTEIPPPGQKIHIPNPPTRAAGPEMWRN